MQEGGGRPETEENNHSGVTSVTSYLMGELYSYSDGTAEKYLAMVQHAAAAGQNPVIEIYDNTARSYGFADAGQAEAYLAAK